MSNSPRRERHRARPASVPAQQADPPPPAAPPRRRAWLLALSVAALAAWFAALLWMAWRD